MRSPHRFEIALAFLLVLAPLTAMARNSGQLSRIFSPDMIGADLAYFEQATGPAWKTDGNAKTYKLGSCVVTAIISHGSVRSLRLELSPNCTFDLNRFLPNFHGKFPSPNKMTFGEFDNLTGGTGQFMADCLTMCGNAYDPVVYEHWYGSNADLAIEVMLEAVQASIPAIDAAAKWQAAMQQSEGEAWVLKNKFNCSHNKYDKVAHEVFRDVQISAITIGYDIRGPQCEH